MATSELRTCLIYTRVTSGQYRAFISTTVRAASVRDNQLNPAFRSAALSSRASQRHATRNADINRWPSLIPINDTRYRELRFRLADPRNDRRVKTDRLLVPRARSLAFHPTPYEECAPYRVASYHTHTLGVSFSLPLYFTSYSLFENDTSDMR